MFSQIRGIRADERHLHPSVYKRIRKTKELLQKGVDPKEFETRGGLDLDTYQALETRWLEQQQRMDEAKKEVIAQYGSLKNAPMTGPCKKIEPVIGSRNALVLLTEFKDIKHKVDPNYFKELLFSKGKNRSMRDYYLESSWNQLDIDGNVNGHWYTASKNRDDYVDKYPINGHYPNAQKLVTETILQAKTSREFDFSPFARNGKIDMLIVIFAGYGLDTKLNIMYVRPHKDKLAKPIELQRGIWADRYCLIPELPRDDVGVFCHEIGHLLGLPDLYNERSPVVGGWCLMALGDHINDGRTPAHPSAWCKLHMGWTEPIRLNGLPQSQDLPSVIDSKKIYRIDAHGSAGKEYFLLENRQQKGFDRYLPGSGMLIWHVNEARCVVQAPNYDSEHLFLTLKESDGRRDLQRDQTVLVKQEGVEKTIKDLMGDIGDAYPGNTINRNFNDKSNPNSNTYQGNKSMVSVTSISDSEDFMKAEMGVQFQSISGKTSPETSSKPSESTQETSPKPSLASAKAQEYVLSQFMAMMTSREVEDPYDEGYEDAILDFIDNNGLNFYKEGYHLGYLSGYKIGKKDKKI